jgi:hypothetical protein
MAQREVVTRNLRLVQRRTEITVDFVLTIGTKAAAPGTTLTLVPTLANGTKSVGLTPVVVRGRRAELLDRRSDIGGGKTAAVRKPEAIAARNGMNVRYHAVVPFEEWMPGAALTLRGESEGCAFVVQTLLGTVAEGVIVPAADFTATETVVIPGAVLSTADKLVQHFPFVQPAPAGGGYTDAPHSSRVSRMEGGLKIFFQQGGDKVLPDYRDNYRSLVDLLSVIEEVRRSSDSEIDRIAITGFASPEGNHEANLRLSLRRAEAMRRVIEQNAPALAGQIRTYAGGEDWEGLRELVAASDMPSKGEVLRIIDTVPSRDGARQQGQKGELIRLDGGRVYRWLERTIFPELREATFIVVYYKNRIQSDNNVNF